MICSSMRNHTVVFECWRHERRGIEGLWGIKCKGSRAGGSHGRAMRQAFQSLERKTSTTARRCCESELPSCLWCVAKNRCGALCIEKVVNYWHAYNEKLLVMFLNQTRASIN
jgi:hypothetical protein